MSNFRFSRVDIPYLAYALNLPGKFKRVFAFFFADLPTHADSFIPESSLIANQVIEQIYHDHGYLLQTLDQPWLAPNQLVEMSDAVSAKGAALLNCWGFVDGTVRVQLKILQIIILIINVPSVVSLYSFFIS